MIENYKQIKIKSNSALCNSLRRIMIAEIQTFAIEYVSIIQNDSIIVDEMIAQRLGLIPIYTTDNTIKEIHYELNVSNISDNILDVYSSDIKFKYIINSNNEKIVRDNIKLHENIIITKLKKNQSINMNCIAIAGIGLIHSKWSPSCGTSYRDNEDGTFDLNIETTGVIEPTDLYLKSIDHLITKLNHLLM